MPYTIAKVSQPWKIFLPSITQTDDTVTITVKGQAIRLAIARPSTISNGDRTLQLR